MSGLRLEATIETVGLSARESRVLSLLEEGLPGAVYTAAQEGAGVAVREHRYKDQTGRLTRSIRARLTDVSPRSVSAEIVALAPYAKFVEEGTEPHEIRPKRAKALRWEDPGGVHFARVVHHPGTRPYPFMGPAYLKAEAVLEREIGLLVQKMAEAFGG